MMKYLLLAYTILNPLFFMFNVEARVSQEWFFQISSVALIMAGYLLNSNKVKADKFNRWFIAIFLWFLVVYFLTVSGWSVIFNFLCGILVYFTILKNCKKEDLKYLIWGVAIVTIYALIYWAFQFVGYDMRGGHMRNTTRVPDCSFFGIKAALGVYLATALPLLLTISWVPILIFLAIAFTYSTGALAGAGLAIMIFAWIRKRIMFWILLPFLLIGSIFFVVKMDSPMGMYGTRLPMWGLVIQDIHLSPIIGFGLDSFRQPIREKGIRYFKDSGSNHTLRFIKHENDYITEETPSNVSIERIRQGLNPVDFWDHPHNEFIWIAYETGLVGLGLLLAFLWQIWGRFKRSMRTQEQTALFCAIVAVAVSSLVQFPLHLARNAYIIPLILGFFYLHTEEQDANS